MNTPKADESPPKMKRKPYEKELRGFVRAVAEADQSLLLSTYADACKTLAATLAVVG